MAKKGSAEGVIDLSVIGTALLEGLEIIIKAADREVRMGSTGVVAEEAVSSEGTDDLGKFVSQTVGFKEKYTDGKGRVWDKSIASMEVKTYNSLGIAVVKTSSTVDWGEFAPEGAVRLEFESIPGLEKLLSLHMFSDSWSRARFETDLSKLPNRTQMMLWETKDEEYGCILPLVSQVFKCDLNSRTGKPGADLTSFDVGLSKCEAPAFVVGLGDDPYELVQRCFVAGMHAAGKPGKLRWEKEYPEFLEYIGWCTWDALYQNQNEKDIVTKLKAFKKAKFPVKFLLIDDGWSPVEEGQLTSLDIDRKKFPRGLAPLVNDAREKYGIWWVGLWHTYNAYWRGIKKGSEAYCRTKEHLLETKRGSMIPYPDAAKGFGFWNEWHSWMRSQGISFVKVDNQGGLYNNSRGVLPIGKAGRGGQYALQASVDLNLSGWMINCMCMTNEAAWHWINSNVSRNSDDFFPKHPETAPEHARQNCYNNLFYSNLNWPDWDMWWSDHPRAKYHAALRAISGGPVYVSDAIDSSDFDVLRPLVFSDGKLLRCDDPALPTRDCLFANPKENPVPLKMWNMSGEVGIIGAFNATDGEVAVKGSMRPSDVEGIIGDSFAVREFFSGQTRVIGYDNEWEFELEPYAQKLWTIAPIEDGVALLGLADKYISPAAVEAEFSTEEALAIELHEGGDFLAYLEEKPKSVMVNGKKAKYTYEDGWLSVPCKPEHHTVVMIYF